VEGTSMAAGNLQLKHAPLCPGCGSPILSQSLLFDEDYSSHSFYQYELAQEWFLTHDIIIFVGTSFSVGITAEAITLAKKYRKSVYNFNLRANNDPLNGADCWGASISMFNVLGSCEVTLPSLYNYMFALAGKPRMYFYPVSNPYGEFRYSIPV
jgi:NAD-dependent SIR2 family protein deacetylase